MRFHVGFSFGPKQILAVLAALAGIISVLVGSGVIHL